MILEGSLFICNHDKLINTIHGLLVRHPDCFILQRVCDMMFETPEVTDADYTTRIANNDGTVTYYNPSCRLVHWKNANIVMKLNRSNMYCNYRSQYFQLAMEMLTKDGNAYDVCYELLKRVIQHCSSEHLDKLAGSLVPTTTPPEPDPQTESASEVSSWPTRLRNRRYQPIELNV
jgi:hypothetical protein